MILPPEVIENIVTNLEYDARSLAACMLSSRQLSHARVLLFRNVCLASEQASTRLLRIVADLPHLIQLIVHIEIRTLAARSAGLGALCALLCGPLDDFGRYHGAGSLCSVALIDVHWGASGNCNALLGLLSCSSITSITLHNSNLFADYLAYLSPNLRTLRFYDGIISSFHPAELGLAPPPISAPIQPPQITSLDLMGSTVGTLTSGHNSLFTFSNSLRTLRIFIEFAFEWNHYFPIFAQHVQPLAPLHTLSLVFSSRGSVFYRYWPHVSLSLGFDLSNPHFLNLRTLNIYANTKNDSLPVCSLIFWIAATLDQLPPQKSQLDSVVVHLKLSTKSQLANLGLLEDWDRLLVAVNRFKSLARLAFVVKIKPRDDPEVETMYNDLAQLVHARLSHRRAAITIKKDQIMWPPKDVHTSRVFIKPN
ncbi:hypothetical protein APHAL10511_005681 [Amanita phalloides]|nr:hypothetical protein APHAL10511_005681 [Amanita phalloides]